MNAYDLSVLKSPWKSECAWCDSAVLTDIWPRNGLSVRAMNCLASLGCRTVGDVRKASDYELLRLPNLGRRTLREIRGMFGQDADVARIAAPPEPLRDTRDALTEVEHTLDRVMAKMAALVDAYRTATRG